MSDFGNRNVDGLSDSQFEPVFEAAPDAIFIVNEGGRIVRVNQQAERMFGYKRSELVGASIETLVPERYRFGHVRFRDEYIAHPRTRPMGSGLELFGLRKNGTEVPVEISLSPVQLMVGQQIIAVVRDVSDQRASQKILAERTLQLEQQAELLRQTAAELARSNAELEQFTYVASHDLQEPLRMVASYTQLLARRYRGKLDADADEFINYAVDGAMRMQSLIEDLLSYARVGSRGRAFETVDCQALVERTLVDLQPSLQEACASVEVGELPSVWGDAVQLKQLFQNLISNALKYRGDNPTHIEIVVDRREKEWVFTVRDNGIGIAPEYHEQIFAMFRRLHPRERYAGTGIGLAICRKIVARHGGRIWVESEPGQGASFLFALPIGHGTSE